MSADPTPYLEASRPLAWLHVPKTGTSLINTLVHTPGLCPGVPSDMVINRTTYCNQCNPFNNWMAGHFESQYPAHLACPDGVLKYAAHVSIGGTFQKHYKGHGVTLLRQPEQRLISSYNHNLHDFPRATLGGRPENISLPKYAELVQGCYVKMLTGKHVKGNDCGEPGAPKQQEVRKAKRRLQTFAFVGIMEEWDQSICLWHAMFGGLCYGSELMDTRDAGGGTAEGHDYPLEDLQGFVDHADREVYAFAQEIFRERSRQYGVSRASCQACYDHAAQHWAPEPDGRAWGGVDWASKQGLPPGVPGWTG